MKVLIVHNSYQQHGGEDTVVANERSLLEQHGVETRLWSVSNDVITSPWSKIAAAVCTPYSRPARRALKCVIDEFKPAVVHVHNFFPLLTPSIYDACRNAGVAVVQTLHNYRTICAGALLLRGGHLCEDCISGSPYQAVLHGCYRGSRLGSLAVARMIEVHRRRGTWSQKVDQFIALSNFAKIRFVAAGFPKDRISIKPNFTHDQATTGAASREGALYIGRLSPEKGVAALLRAWNHLDVRLRVIGDGPLRDLVRNAMHPKIIAVGQKTPTEVASEMARASFLVMPSEWPETFGMVVIEAFAQGLPVIASRVGALEEIVDDSITGLLFPAGDAEHLTTLVRWASQNPKAMQMMGTNARRVYEERYSPAVNFRQLTKVYLAAIARSCFCETVSGSER